MSLTERFWRSLAGSKGRDDSRGYLTRRSGGRDSGGHWANAALGAHQGKNWLRMGQGFQVANVQRIAAARALLTITCLDFWMRRLADLDILTEKQVLTNLIALDKTHHCSPLDHWRRTQRRYCLGSGQMSEGSMLILRLHSAPPFEGSITPRKGGDKQIMRVHGVYNQSVFP